MSYTPYSIHHKQQLSTDLQSCVSLLENFNNNEDIHFLINELNAIKFPLDFIFSVALHHYQPTLILNNLAKFAVCVGNLELLDRLQMFDVKLTDPSLELAHLAAVHATPAVLFYLWSRYVRFSWINAKNETPQICAGLANKIENRLVILLFSREFDKAVLQLMDYLVDVNTMSPQVKSYLKSQRHVLTRAFIEYAHTLPPEKQKQVVVDVLENRNSLGVILNTPVSRFRFAFSLSSKTGCIEEIKSAFKTVLSLQCHSRLRGKDSLQPNR